MCLDIILLCVVLPRASVSWVLQVPPCCCPRVNELFLQSWQTHRNYVKHAGIALDVSLLLGVEQLPFCHGQMCHPHTCSPVLDHYPSVVENEM